MFAVHIGTILISFFFFFFWQVNQKQFPSVFKYVQCVALQKKEFLSALTLVYCVRACVYIHALLKLVCRHRCVLLKA